MLPPLPLFAVLLEAWLPAGPPPTGTFMPCPATGKFPFVFVPVGTFTFAVFIK